MGQARRGQMNRVRELADGNPTVEIVREVLERLDDTGVETPTRGVQDLQPEKRRLESVESKPVGLRQTGSSQSVAF